MDLEKAASQLSAIERKTLKALESGSSKSIEEIQKDAGIQLDSVRRALQWLNEKKLIDLEEQKTERLKLSPAGKSSLRKGLPEKMFIEALAETGGKAGLGGLRKKSQLNAPEFNVAMGIAKRNAWIAINKSEKGIELELTGLEKDLLEGRYELEKAINAIEEKRAIDSKTEAELMKRGLAEKEASTERSAAINEQGKKALKLSAGKREYNVEGEVPGLFVGKKQPYVAFLSKVRRKLVELGFQEMKERLIVQEFYNFDVLFQPQNHPARSWTDTYQLKQPQYGKLPKEEIVARVKAAHENGANTGSRGWGYKWSEKIASRLMPNAHGTTADARQLIEGVTIPGKYFVINRCYRPDVVDAKHLSEFNQLDGFVVGREINFKHLLGILKEIAVEVADAKRVRFATGYFPFTEPSCELYVEHPKMGWIEVGGAGVFRPELTQPLGVKEPVIAWGLGVDRLAMIKLGIKDIRELFSSNLSWLRNAPAVQF